MREKFIIAIGYDLPAIAPVTVDGADVTVPKITAKRKFEYTISGNCGVSGATVSLDNGDSTESDENGDYSFSGLSNGSYIVTPMASATDFTPFAWTVNVQSADVSGVNFDAETIDVTVTITGYGKEGALVTLSKEGTILTGTTDSNGVCIITQVPNGTYTITVEQDGYSYAIDEETGVVSGADIAIGGIVGSEVTVSGRVVDPVGAGVSGVLLTITGGQTDTTDADGYWSIGPVLDGEYTVTPTKNTYDFTPETRDVTVNRENVAVSTFTGSSLPYQGLVAYWPLTDGSALDQSGKGHTLTVTGALTANATDPSGTANKVHQFTGSEYLSVADHNDFDFGTGEFTISLWANGLGNIGADGFRSLINKNRPSIQSPTGQYCWSFEWYLANAGGAEYPRFYQDAAIVGTSSGVGDMKNGSGNGTGTWYHIVLVRTTSAIYIYINNVKYTCTYTNCGLSNDKTLNIGGDATGYTIKWKGSICHVRIHQGYAFTDADVANVYNAKT
jgi:hypothetical protein